MSRQGFWLFVCRKPPYGSAWASACLELLLTAAAFEREAVLMFQEEGVLQLVKGQDSSGIGLKDQSRALPALELYDVRRVLADGEAMARLGLSADDLVLPVEIVEAGALRGLMEEAAQVFLF